MIRTGAALFAGALIAAGCASTEETPRLDAAAADTAVAVADTAPPEEPARTGGTRSKGTLSMEDLGVRLVGRGNHAGLRVDITTLDEGALQLAAEDIAAHFRDLKTRIPDAVPDREARELTPFLVGYTGFEKEVGFDPTLLQLRSEGSTHYPRYVIPVSPRFDRRLVDLYETVYGIYLFGPGVDLFAPLEFQYGELSTGNDWLGVVREIQRAKARITSESG